MGRFTARLFCAAGMLGLAAVGFAEPPGQPKQEPKKAAAPPAVAFDWAMVPAVQGNDALVQRFEQQYGPQVRQMCRTELHLVRLVTQPTKPQYAKIAADGDAALKAAIPRFAETAFRGVGNSSDLRALLTEALAQSIRTHLSPEQATRYQAELDQRATAHRRATVLSLVAMMDTTLLLSADQRSRLEMVLELNWDNSWHEFQNLVLNGYWPAMPDAKITPILTPAQQAVWRGIAKGNVRFGFNLGIMTGIDIPDEVWDDDRPPKPADGKGAIQDKGMPKAGEKK